MSSELNLANLKLEQAIRDINKTPRYHRDFVDADAIDSEEGLREALAIAIEQFTTKINALESGLEQLRKDIEEKTNKKK